MLSSHLLLENALLLAQCTRYAPTAHTQTASPESISKSVSKSIFKSMSKSILKSLHHCTVETNILVE